MTRFRFRALIVGCAAAFAFIIPGCFDWEHEPPCIDRISASGAVGGDLGGSDIIC